jgi:hypothetical protein
LKLAVFHDSASLIQFAEDLVVKERINSLKKDVNHCLTGDSVFPALLYCFSTIDLLGALSEGHAGSGSHTEHNFKQYLLRFMKNTNTGAKYDNEQSELLQEIFRHKLVHLAQPNIIKRRNKEVAWRYEYPDITNHLKIEAIGYRKQNVTILTPVPLYYDHIFIISVTQLLYDIVDSVERRPDGYIQRLKDNYKDLQKRFDDAIRQIYVL